MKQEPVYSRLRGVLSKIRENCDGLADDLEGKPGKKKINKYLRQASHGFLEIEAYLKAKEGDLYLSAPVAEMLEDRMRALMVSSAAVMSRETLIQMEALKIIFNDVVLSPALGKNFKAVLHHLSRAHRIYGQQKIQNVW